MVKKVILGLALCGLIGILVFGAVRHTLDKTSQTAATGSGQGHALSVQQNGGQQNGSGGLGEAAVEQWITLEGSVADFDESWLSITLAQDGTLAIDGRAWIYAQEQGFAVHTGDQLTMLGFYDSGIFRPAQINNLATGQSVTLRDDAGRPLWSGGRGRRDI